MSTILMVFVLILVLLVLLRLFAADVYDVVIVWMTATWYRVVFERLKKGDRVLDVGIGTATALIKNKALLFEKHLSVVGLDYEAAYIRKAEAVLRDAGLWQSPPEGTEGYRPGEFYCRAKQASIYDDDLAEFCYEASDKGKDLKNVPEEKRFDAAYFSGSLTVMPDPPAALRAVLPLLKRDGRVYITQTFQKQGSPVMSVVKPLLKHITTIDFGQLTTVTDLENILRAADGFEVVENGPISGSVDTRFQAARLIVLRPKK
eukprot:TRINITY_DN6326_c0_g2_i7.p1 TRINITY_DN6326_c0_g2~~TRINITY_DN6326_c0_g2_i7.p1  ORF type:complete len:260 (+),score=44.84 TRINITY_DN6326_c0_g2_i7:87-866(+)